ncbi:ATPase [Bifidobacterium margollesii]|uniref:ATPase n=1 Tax=Bifidobacterium margollesii TaxID=2020964 RepID=A0A2N5JC94_9BIFI|nr:ATP-binding protein [Bifidobacterium margollesii]PLS31828.1 ATPase [Bifidobacterium margollesii]
MAGFIGRDRELSVLNRRYDTGDFECVIVYGRRRVGKTTLINQFVGAHSSHSDSRPEHRQAIFFSALEASEARNLEELSRAIALFVNGNDGLDSFPIYPSFAAAVEAIFALAEQERVVLVIDEYPYLAKADRSVSSVLQHAIDRHKDSSHLMVILCGSSMSFMERQVLGYQSPLYGRRTAQIKVEPFGFADVQTFLSHYSAQDALASYSLTDGIPQYLRQIDDTIGIQENIERNMFDPGCYLFEEPDNLLKQELRNPMEYNGIIQAIASGASRMSEISTAVHLDSSACSTYIRNLIDLDLVHREIPFGQKNSRKAIYRLADSFFRFWYRFVPPNMSLIQSGHVDLAARRTMSQLPAFLGPVFEDVCLEWLWRHNGGDVLPFLMLESGRWWGADPHTRRQEEIDIMATGEDPDVALFGECKWKNARVGMEDLKTLRRQSQIFRYERNEYYLFSKSGFTDDLLRVAETDPTVHTVAFDDMTW